MPKVVVLGAGFAGLSAASELLRLRKRVRDLDVIVVDRNNFMTFTPLLPEAATGSIEMRAVTQPLRALLAGARVELGDVVALDETARTMSARHPITQVVTTIGYDELILALGSTPSTMGIEGVERATLPLRTVADAQRLRSALVGAIEVATETKDLVERDRLLRFVVVGGGFTGVEVAGEITAFLRSILRFYPALQAHPPSVGLLQGEQRLLPHLPEHFGTYAARVLRQRGVDVRTGAKVRSVDPAGLTLESGERFDSRTILWDVGNEPAPFVKRLGLPLSKDGAIETARDCSVVGHAHLWAIGDCAAIPQDGGKTYAPLAQNATREGPLVARNVIARLRGERTKAFRYRMLGQMASLGNRTAVAELPGGVMLKGLLAWLLWHAYYLGRVPSGARRTRVAVDWTIDLMQPRSPVRLPERIA